MYSIADYILTVNNETKIGLHFSGGADSALLLYMLCMYKRDLRPDVEIFPLIFQEEEKNYQLESTSQIINLVEKISGVHLQSFVFDPSFQQDLQLVKKIETKILFAKNKIHCIFNAVTANPPLLVCNQWISKNPHLRGPETIRSEANRDVFFPYFNVNGRICLTYRPFVNIDKKQIYELYKTFDLLDDLFPLTRSCNELGRHTISHCGKCFWCFERFWGFGRY